MKGVSAAILRKSSRRRSTPAARAIAIRWIVAFVEPPVTCHEHAIRQPSAAIRWIVAFVGPPVTMMSRITFSKARRMHIGR